LTRLSFRCAVALIVPGKYYAISDYNGTPPPIGNRTPLTFDKGSVIDVYSDDGDFFEVSSLMCK